MRSSSGRGGGGRAADDDRAPAGDVADEERRDGEEELVDQRLRGERAVEARAALAEDRAARRQRSRSSARPARSVAVRT